MVNLVAAYILKHFQVAARRAVADRLEREAPAFQPRPGEPVGGPMRVFIGLSRAWPLSTEGQVALLGLRIPAGLNDLMQLPNSEIATATIERLALLLNIFRSVNTILPDAGSADAWMRAPNSAKLFAGRSALALMMEGLEPMRRVHTYLLAQPHGN